MSLSQLDDNLILLRGRLAARERELASMREAAADAAEAAAWRLRAAQQEAAALRRALDEAQALAAPESDLGSEPAAEGMAERVMVEAAPPRPAPPVLAAMPAAAPRRRLRRVVALPIWRLVRPIVRPVLWRVRSFFTADAVREIAALRAAHEAMQDITRETVREAVHEALSRAASPPAACAQRAPRQAYSGRPSHGLGLGDTAAERWLLTVALEGGRG